MGQYGLRYIITVQTFSNNIAHCCIASIARHICQLYLLYVYLYLSKKNLYNTYLEYEYTIISISLGEIG